MMRFAEEAARFFPTIEIVEMHRAEKRDKPSGTAAATAERIKRSGGPADVPIHSVRLQGLLAHQEVLCGGGGELLTIRHDSLSRESFAAGILFAIRNVRALKGLHVGLDGIL
jgi:4-hydroxy-tetrahydrodipicolinate reductase